MILLLKYKLFFLLMFTSFIVFGQKKIEYSDTKNSSTINYIVIDNDTLYGSYTWIKKKQISHFCKFLNNNKIIRLYHDVVFNNYNCGKYQPVETKQWSSNIVVFMDKKIPRRTRKAFAKFFMELKVTNLSISFTKNIDKANYFIKGTSESFLENEVISDKDEVYPHKHVTYSLIGDDNRKFYSGILKINLDKIIDNTLILSKLKQLFFISLGQFSIDKDVTKDSLLSYKYNNSEFISKADIALLNLHYLKIHDIPLTCSTYDTFIKNIQTKCKL